MRNLINPLIAFPLIFFEKRYGDDRKQEIDTPTLLVRFHCVLTAYICDLAEYWTGEGWKGKV